jgi:hypothetical protein
MSAKNAGKYMQIKSPSARHAKGDRLKLESKMSAELTEIAQKFILPLVKVLQDPLGDKRKMSEGSKIASDSALSYKDCIDIIFGVRYRDIVPAIAKEAFSMPGLVWGDAGGADAKPGTKLQHHVNKDAKMLVRIDERTPEVIDIEVMTSNHSSTMFVLNRSQYCSIFKKLKESTPCQQLNRLLPPGTFTDLT